MRRNNVASQPTLPTVGAGFRARPALVDGKRRFARIKRCAGCALGIAYVGLWTEAGTPWETWVLSVTLNVCVYRTPAITQPRGVEDAAPYGWVRDIRCGMLCKWYVCPAPPKCARAVPAGLHTLGGGRCRAHRG